MAAINRHHFDSEAHRFFFIGSVGQGENLLFLAGFQGQFDSGFSGPDALRIHGAAAVTDQADILQGRCSIEACRLAGLQDGGLAGSCVPGGLLCDRLWLGGF